MCEREKGKGGVRREITIESEKGGVKEDQKALKKYEMKSVG